MFNMSDVCYLTNRQFQQKLQGDLFPYFAIYLGIPLPIIWTS